MSSASSGCSSLFEEINFLKQVDGNTVFLSLFLTLLNTPSVLLEIFPFIFLISGMYFFIEIIDREEISIYKLYGLTNLKIITSLSLMTFLIGTFILIFFYHISSNLKFVYLEMKSPDDEMCKMLMAKLFFDKQIIIKNKEIFDFIFKRLNRTYFDIYIFVEKLDRLSLEKKRQLTIPLIKEII